MKGYKICPKSICSNNLDDFYAKTRLKDYSNGKFYVYYHLDDCIYLKYQQTKRFYGLSVLRYICSGRLQTA